MSGDREVDQDVGAVLVRYATGIDRRDWDLFRTCFTADVEADYGDIGVWHGIDEITRFMIDIHAGCGHTLHRITNIAVTAVDDDHAEARAYVDALVMFAGNAGGVRAAGYYDDELVRGDDGWRIARRHFTSVHTEVVGEPMG
jgi:3-phenylpropionate/cinnamic acid dioxygenase small subunit